MSSRVLVSWPGQEQNPELHPIKALPDLLKTHPEGLSRAPYFLPEGIDAATARGTLDGGTLPLAGPFLISHSIRRASDLLLENCSYEGVTINLEVDGKKLPELPSAAELRPLLERDSTMILVDGRSYRPAADVFGFDQVYNDAVKFIDGLKTLGVTTDAMAIYATPDEICIEVHPGIFGFADDPALARRHALVLMHLAGIRRNRGRLVKTGNRTVRIETLPLQTVVLLPGSNHPTLHRPKVGVGPSHFAYGPAAFSDFCGKKRSLDDCLKELRVWLKFLETPRDQLPALASLVERLEGEASAEPEPPSPAAPGGRERPSGAGFAPLAQDLRKPEAQLIVPGTLPTPWLELNKALAGGFVPRGLHLIAGGREEGKASFLLSIGLAAAAKRPVLFLSREQTLPEFGGRLLAHLRKIPSTDWASRTMVPGVEGEATRKKVQEAVGELARATPQNLYFRGADSHLRIFDLDELGELAKLLPGGAGSDIVLILEGLDPIEATPEFLRRLRSLCAQRPWTVILGLHTSLAPTARPQFIEGSDLELLRSYQGAVDTILHLQSERINLKKFLAMAQGKVDPAIVEKLEAKFSQAAGGDKRRHDTFTLVRLLHSRWGNRSAILYFFQREYGLFWEGPAMPLGRP